MHESKSPRNKLVSSVGQYSGTYSCQNPAQKMYIVPLSVPTLLFLQSIRIDVVVTVGTCKVPSAHLCSYESRL